MWEMSKKTFWDYMVITGLLLETTDVAFKPEDSV
jgi:hypothetical protein